MSLFSSELLSTHKPVLLMTDFILPRAAFHAQACTVDDRLNSPESCFPRTSLYCWWQTLFYSELLSTDRPVLLMTDFILLRAAFHTHACTAVDRLYSPQSCFPTHMPVLLMTDFILLRAAFHTHACTVDDRLYSSQSCFPHTCLYSWWQTLFYSELLSTDRPVLLMTDFILVRAAFRAHACQWRIQQYAHDAVRTHWNID